MADHQHAPLEVTECGHESIDGLNVEAVRGLNSGNSGNRSSKQRRKLSLRLRKGGKEGGTKKDKAEE